MSTLAMPYAVVRQGVGSDSKETVSKLNLDKKRAVNAIRAFCTSNEEMSFVYCGNTFVCNVDEVMQNILLALTELLSRDHIVANNLPLETLKTYSFNDLVISKSLVIVGIMRDSDSLQTFASQVDFVRYILAQLFAIRLAKVRCEEFCQRIMSAQSRAEFGTLIQSNWQDDLRCGVAINLDEVLKKFGDKL